MGVQLPLALFPLPAEPDVHLWRDFTAIQLLRRFWCTWEARLSNVTFLRHLIFFQALMFLGGSGPAA